MAVSFRVTGIPTYCPYLVYNLPLSLAEPGSCRPCAQQAVEPGFLHREVVGDQICPLLLRFVTS